MTPRRFNLAVYLIVFVALADQMSKWLVTRFIMQPPHIEPVTSFFNLVLVRNRGVTFGFMNQLNPEWSPYFLLAIAAVILLLLGRWLWRTSSSWVAAALGLIMGGAIGNVIDRAVGGAVTDFLDFYLRFGGQEHHWPAFNLADSAIVTGVALLLLDGLIRGR